MPGAARVAGAGVPASDGAAAPPAAAAGLGWGEDGSLGSILADNVLLGRCLMGSVVIWAVCQVVPLFKGRKNPKGITSSLSERGLEQF
jgi:hypothetical protein